ncbi:SDR family NAD(P)-dependent oxidoreductase [Novacetimonas hansenii]|uniref:SDR family NAD(P)-dependent oxidoreductase n=1 Tax=Novacetimonas hansenii TaxID=436 RepID=A0AAW5ESP7_NOVHA|nr:SDR family NAD(P)-dependent oxidoreductase [Novacetimonas hansenii]MCJ8354201.1 SDR family NAD(P)-dependent oxidoreductase [Novacetimonas hansenii]
MLTGEVFAHRFGLTVSDLPDLEQAHAILVLPGVSPREARYPAWQINATGQPFPAASVERAVDAAGPIDVLVNNAGFGAVAPVELTAPETARALFETNVLGTLAMVRAVAPHMRRRRAGVIVNVSSTVTVKTLPLIGVYSASKAAVNAFTASLALEMQPFGVRAHLVLPGRAPQTRFGDNAMPHLRGMDDLDYSPQLQGFVQSVLEDQGPVTHATDVAQAVWRAATDPAAPLRIAAGADAELWMAEAGLA